MLRLGDDACASLTLLEPSPMIAIGKPSENTATPAVMVPRMVTEVSGRSE